MNSLEHNLNIKGKDCIIEKWPVYGVFFLSFTLFLLPFPRSWSNFALGAMLFSGLVGWATEFKKLRAGFFKMWLICFPPVMYFAFNLIATLWSSGGIATLQRPLMFLLIPILGYPVFSSEHLEKNLYRILRLYILGILSVILILLMWATFNSILLTDGKLEFRPIIVYSLSRYNSVYLSVFEHPTYLAMKTLWAVVLIIYFRDKLFLSRSVRYVMIMIMLLFIYLLSSRTGILTTLLILFIIIFNYIKSFAVKLSFIVLMLFLIYPVYRVIILNQRVNFSLIELSRRIKSSGGEIRNIDERTREWYSAIQLIKKKPLFGYGHDYQEKLIHQYRENGFEHEAESRFNAHNQYLETHLQFGLPGITILIWILFVPLLMRNKSPHPFLYILFLVLITVNFMFESMLVRQWGIMFFMIFYFLLTKWTIASDQPE